MTVFLLIRQVESLFSKWLIEYPGLQLIVAVLPGRNRQLYPEIKRVGDSVLGIPTQCVQLKHVQEARGQLCANISLKINAKLGGVNHVVDRSVKSLVFRVPSIIFGAGMSQPSSLLLLPVWMLMLPNIRLECAHRGTRRGVELRKSSMTWP